MMTITQAAAHLNMSRASIYAAIAAGHIRAEMLLGRQIVSKTDVLAYVPRAYEGKRGSQRPLGVRGPGGRPRKNKSEAKP